MQFKHWSALGPSQPWSPHSGWHGPEEREISSVWEKLSTLLAPLPGFPEYTLPGLMDIWTLPSSDSISYIYYILNFILSIFWNCMALGACLSSSSSQNESYLAILWLNTGAGAALKEGPAPQGAAETPAPACAGGGKVGRGAFFTPQTAAPPICGWDGAFSYLLISPSCCPVLATGTAPPNPPQPQAGSGLMAPPVFIRVFISLGTLGGTTWQLRQRLPAYSSSSSATSTWLCRKAALDGSISEVGTSSDLPRDWGPLRAV